MRGRARRLINSCENNESQQRYVNPADINLAFGYKIEVFIEGLDHPVSIFFSGNGEMYIAEAGSETEMPRILKIVNDHLEIFAENFEIPITGASCYNDIIYVTHRGRIDTLKFDGTRQKLMEGLPCNGDYLNSNVTLGPDNKIYFGQGTATNSGVVGIDNHWIFEDPQFHDNPGDYILLNGQNFTTENVLTTLAKEDTASTGAFSPFGVPNLPYELKKGLVKASGSILRANLDGSELQLFAWGFRNPSYVNFDRSGRLYVSNNAYQNRGSRPIANALDEFFLVTEGLWYGWPDYNAGDPVTLSRFKPLQGEQPQFLLANHPNNPPRPFAAFPSRSNIMGFDFNYNKQFGNIRDIFIAEFGSIESRDSAEAPMYTHIGHRISKIEVDTGEVSTFAINKSGFPSSITREGGFERPSGVTFGPDGAMYILDMGINVFNDPLAFIPNTGVIWKVTKV